MVETEQVKGSRFIGEIAPVLDESQAKDHLAKIREKHPGATHYCWAFKLSDGRALSSDDGEPSGSAGAPIARHIDGSQMSNLQIVVIRYFGGTKLGVGGLIRAYGDCAALALSSVPTITEHTRTNLTFRHGHELTGIIEGVLNRFDYKVSDTTWGVDVLRSIDVIDEQYEQLKNELIEQSAAKIEFVDNKNI